jgi:hypothetical protein
MALLELDTTCAFTFQDCDKIELICQTVSIFGALPLPDTYLLFLKACEYFPILNQYDNCWPVMDILRMKLKYTSMRTRVSKKMIIGSTISSRFKHRSYPRSSR